MDPKDQSFLQRNQNSKKLFFLIGYPRSGNTLLTSILNQNPNIGCTGNSITLEMMARLYLLKQDDLFKNFPDHQSYDNVLHSIYDLYYSDWPQEIIIDRGPVMTTGNMEMMKECFGLKFKCIVLLRDLKNVLASYVKWFTNEPTAFVNKYGKTTEEKLNYLIKPGGAIHRQHLAIENSYNYKDMCYYINYDDLVTNTKQTFINLYKFINTSWYDHDFKNIKQFKINNISYNDSIVGKNMHKLKQEIKKEPNDYVSQVPESIIKKYAIRT